MCFLFAHKQDFDCKTRAGPVSYTDAHGDPAYPVWLLGAFQEVQFEQFLQFEHHSHKPF